MTKNRHINLDGWRMTPGSYRNDTLKCTIHKAWERGARRSHWKLVWDASIREEPSKRFTTVYEAIQYVDKQSLKVKKTLSTFIPADALSDISIPLTEEEKICRLGGFHNV